MNRKSLFLVLTALAIFLPTGISLFNGLSLSAEQEQKSHTFLLPVTGYDPRDIFHGRYAMLQIDWSVREVDEACRNGQDCGICLSDQGTGKIARIFEVKQKDYRCSFFIPRRSRTFENMMLPVKFYLDERRADAVDQALRGTSHGFTVDASFPSTGMTLQELYIDGLPYRLFIENQSSGPPPGN